jgi:hypothetical protein
MAEGTLVHRKTKKSGETLTHEEETDHKLFLPCRWCCTSCEQFYTLQMVKLVSVNLKIQREV